MTTADVLECRLSNESLKLELNAFRIGIIDARRGANKPKKDAKSIASGVSKGAISIFVSSSSLI